MSHSVIVFSLTVSFGLFDDNKPILLQITLDKSF